jgi:hypothetical protein
MTMRQSNTPKCRKCGSTNLKATSSQQMRRLNGRQRLVADVVCNGCDHSWWSHDKRILAMARAADAARKAQHTPTDEA